MDESGGIGVRDTRGILVLVGLLAAAGMAGCIGEEPVESASVGNETARSGPNLTEEWPSKALPDSQRHDHNDPTHHQNLSTPNFQVTGYNPLTTDYHGATSGDYFCGGEGSRDGRQFVAVQSFATDVAFVMADVTDPSNPRMVGELALPNTKVWGMTMTEDARFVLLGTHPLERGPDESPSQEPAGAQTSQTGVQATWTDACGTTGNASEDPLPYASGLVLVDVRDPAQPEVVDYVPQPLFGGHTVHARTIEDTTYVLAGVANQAHAASYVSFFTIETTPAGPSLVEYGEYASQWPDDQTPNQQPPIRNGHIDGWIQHHPKTGDLLAYLANWNGGIRVVELQGPGRIQEIGGWSDWDPDAGDAMVGNWHTVLPASTTWNGSHYTFVGQEVPIRPTERPTGKILMLDTTDPTSPRPMARWTLPADVAWEEFLQFTTHYVELDEDERRLFVANAHAGLWAVDLSPASASDGLLDTLGVFLPDRVPPKPQPPGLGSLSYARDTPTVSDVWAVGNETLAVPDGQSGLYTVEFEPTRKVPIPDPWTRDSWEPPGG